MHHRVASFEVRHEPFYGKGATLRSFLLAILLLLLRHVKPC